MYNSVWYKWTAPKTGNYRLEICASSFNTHVKVLTGTAVNALQKIADNNDDPGCGPDGQRSRLTFIAGAGQEYKFQIGSQIDNQTGSISGSLNLVSPPNDFFADSQTLDGTSAPITWDERGRHERGERRQLLLAVRLGLVAGGPRPRPATTASICAAAASTRMLKVLTGTAVNALQKIANNDDDPGCGPDGKRSRMTFIAGAGQEYRIQIGSQVENQTGTISGSLALVSPPNDFFADATTSPAGRQASAATNVDASNEAGEETCCWLYGSVWYRWTAPDSGSYPVETCSSSFNTHLKVLTGTAVNALQKVADNGDAPAAGPMASAAA